MEEKPVKDKGAAQNLSAKELDSSGRVFGLHFSRADWVVVLVTCALAIVSCRRAIDLSSPWSFAIPAAAVAFTYSIAVLFRLFVPFVIRITYPDMLRIRVPFYAWMVCSLLCICFSRPFRSVFGVCDLEMIQVTLLAVGAAQIARFYLVGGMFRLVFAYFLAGLLCGVSAFGVLALVVFIAMLVLMERWTFVDGEDEGEWQLNLAAGVTDYFLNPLVRSRMRWLFLFCFCGGVALSATTFMLSGMEPTEGVVNFVKAFAVAWLSSMTVEGLIVFLLLAALPMFIAFRFAKAATDTLSPLDFGNHAIYLIIGILSLSCLVKADILESVSKLNIVVNDRLWLVILVICGLDLVLAAMVMLVDIRCRTYRGEDEDEAVAVVRERRFDAPMRFSMTLMTVFPVVLFCVALYMNTRTVSNRPRTKQTATLTKEEAAIRCSLMKKALGTALANKEYQQALGFAQSLLAVDSRDACANFVVGKWRFDEGDYVSALRYAEQALKTLPDDVETLEMIADAYRRLGDKTKVKAIEGKIMKVKSQPPPERPEKTGRWVE